MAAPTTPEEAIEQAALGPKSVTVGNQTTIARDVDELIKADQYLAAKASATQNTFGLRRIQLRPGGCG